MLIHYAATSVLSKCLHSIVVVLWKIFSLRRICLEQKIRRKRVL